MAADNLGFLKTVCGSEYAPTAMPRLCSRVPALLGLFLFVVTTGPLVAQDLAAIYHHSDAESRQTSSSGWDAFLAEHRSQRAAGYRLTDLETYRDGADERRYLGLYTKSVLEDHVERVSGWSNFIKLKRAMVDREFTLVDVAAVVNNESDYDFYGVWVKDEHPVIHKVWFLDSKETMLDRTRKMARDRFKIKRAYVLPIPNGEPAFVVLYHFSPVNRFNFIHFADTPEEFAAEIAERRRSKVQLIDYAHYREGNRDQYLGIFQDGDYDAAFLPGVPFGGLGVASDSLAAARGLRLVNLTVN